MERVRQEIDHLLISFDEISSNFPLSLSLSLSLFLLLWWCSSCRSVFAVPRKKHFSILEVILWSVVADKEMLMLKLVEVESAVRGQRCSTQTPAM